jgi:hypothetical protein
LLSADFRKGGGPVARGDTFDVFRAYVETGIKGI